MNLFESNEAQSLHLDGLNFGFREISEMVTLMQKCELCVGRIFLKFCGLGRKNSSGPVHNIKLSEVSSDEQSVFYQFGISCAQG